MATATKRKPKASPIDREWVWPDLSTALEKQRNSGPYHPPKPGSTLPFARLRLRTRPIDSLAASVAEYHSRLDKVEKAYREATRFGQIDYQTATADACQTEQMTRRQALVTALQTALATAIDGIGLAHELRKAWQAEAERLRGLTTKIYADGEKQVRKLFGEQGLRGHLNTLPPIVQNRKDVHAAAAAMNSAIGDKRELELAMEGICLELRQMIDYFRS